MMGKGKDRREKNIESTLSDLPPGYHLKITTNYTQRHLVKWREMGLEPKPPPVCNQLHINFLPIMADCCLPF
ncbi:MAG: hypothetical protein D3908_14840 [Candidatus Electrothrix sp. AUS4]|nr:hypothetical protein [Candidatus Electrothrix sp. AUS4]